MSYSGVTVVVKREESLLIKFFEILLNLQYLFLSLVGRSYSQAYFKRVKFYKLIL